MRNKGVLHSSKIYRSTNLINIPLYPRSKGDNVLSIFFKLAKTVKSIDIYTPLQASFAPIFRFFSPKEYSNNTATLGIASTRTSISIK